MKTVLLAGGFGTRLSEETSARPKPMVEIGGWPILVHIMRAYARYGQKDFIVAGGYKVDFIKEYFANFHLRNHDYTLDLGTGEITPHDGAKLDWRISIVDTGLNTMTGGRLKRLKEHLGGRTFMVTYGDGVADINIERLLAFHKEHGRHATVTAVRPPGRFGSLIIGQDNAVEKFEEKNPANEGWINGGFFVLEPEVLEYIEGDEQPFEAEPLSRLANDKQLAAYYHKGFWQPMDTLRDKLYLESLATSGNPPWGGDD